MFLFSQKTGVWRVIILLDILPHWPFNLLVEPLILRESRHLKISEFFELFSISVVAVLCSVWVCWLEAMYAYVGWQAGERISELGFRLCRSGSIVNSCSSTTGKLSTLVFRPHFPSDPFTYLACPLLSQKRGNVFHSYYKQICLCSEIWIIL